MNLFKVVNFLHSRLGDGQNEDQMLESDNIKKTLGSKQHFNYRDDYILLQCRSDAMFALDYLQRLPVQTAASEQRPNHNAEVYINNFTLSTHMIHKGVGSKMNSFDLHLNKHNDHTLNQIIFF